MRAPMLSGMRYDFCSLYHESLVHSEGEDDDGDGAPQLQVIRSERLTA